MDLVLNRADRQRPISVSLGQGQAEVPPAPSFQPPAPGRSFRPRLAAARVALQAIPGRLILGRTIETLAWTVIIGTMVLAAVGITPDPGGLAP